MAKKKAQYRATRNEKVSSGGQDIVLVAGEVYDDLPDDLIETLGGDHGGLVEVTDEELAAEKEAAAEGG